MKRLKGVPPWKLLLLSLAFTLFFTALSAGVLRDFGRTEIITVQLKTQTGKNVVSRIYKPHSATAQTPAPAIILIHGLTVNKESYAHYGLELARRGFVVITPDMLNHGDSEIVAPEVFLGPPAASDAWGSYAAVRYAGTLDYVDHDQVGLIGHSAGGDAANNCIVIDNAQESRSISSIYLISSDAIYKDKEGGWANIYGSRDVGIYYTLYDHVYFVGSDSHGVPVSTQRWLTCENAKSLFAFGADPSTFEGDEVVPGHTYTSVIDGRQAFRRVNAAKEIHLKPQGNSGALVAVCDFFQDAFQAPNYRMGYDQHYALLTTFNLLGLFGLLAACVFALGSLTRLKFFASLSAGENAALRPAPDKRGKRWFWILTLLNFIFAFLSISGIFFWGFGYASTRIWAQQTSNIYALWALSNGGFMLITSFLSYVLYAGKNAAMPCGWGLKITFSNLVKSMAVSIAVCALVFLVVALANHVFSVDYRYYLWGLKNIPPDNVGTFFAYLPMYLLFGIAVSIALNSAYHCRIGREPEWVNDLFFAAVNTMPALIITVAGFCLYIKSGIKPFIFGSNYTYTYTIHTIAIFPVAVILIRRLFKRCNNPYIPGIIVGILLCWLQVSCAFTLHADMYFGSAAAFQ